MRIEVARGMPPVQGVAGRIDMLIDISAVGKPRKMSDGSVDHHDIGIVINVKQGQSIARFVPPQPGAEGMTVFGKTIPAPALENINFVAGPGTRISPSDPNLLLAEIDGALNVSTDGKIEVRNEKVINGDIDYSTGNVSFTGNLNILGSIRAGFSVESSGDIKIRDNIEDAVVKCEGNLTIGGGAVGSGEGLIECQGELKAKHIENFTVNIEGDMVVGEDIMHSTIVSAGKVKAKLIVGGTILAVEIEAETAGSNSETKTILDIGRKYVLIEERNALQRKTGLHFKEYRFT